MKRILLAMWWLVAMVETIVVVANIAQSHTTDDPALASRASTALQDAGFAPEIQAVGATSNDRVFITLDRAETSAGAVHGGAAELRRIASDVFSGVPAAKAVVILTADHAVAGSYDRRP